MAKLKETIAALFIISGVLAGSSTAAITHQSDVVQLTASPGEVSEGLTQQLTVNCAFAWDQSSLFATLISLILYKADPSQPAGYSELASVSSMSSHDVNVKNQMGAVVTGQIVANGYSYISYTWTYPGNQTLGDYKCDGLGLDSTGHPVSTSTHTAVLERIVDMGVILQHIQAMTAMLNAQQSQINELNARLQQSWDITFQASATYGGHSYYLSQPMLWDIKAGETLCHVHGGYLVEINNDDEFHFIANFLDTVNGTNTSTTSINNNSNNNNNITINNNNINTVAESVAIGMSDSGSEGTFKYMSSGLPVAYYNWATHQPDNAYDCNCVCLSQHHDWEMADVKCIYPSNVRYICEIP